MTTPYYTDLEVRQKIDKIFSDCATIFSNLGTGTQHDMLTTEQAKEKEKQLLSKIQDLDPGFYKDRLLLGQTNNEKKDE